jgi:endonuclease/exonuclease/phosphatase family metal-dependent hydrolase
MTFSILCWNVLYTNQTDDADKLKRLLKELKRLEEQYRPDCIALSEVVQPSKDKLPPVVEHLQALGYNHNHYAHMEHISNYWMSGVVLSSKFALDDRQRHVISKNGSAARYGYPDINKEIISAAVALPGGPNVKIIVAHPSATIDSVKQHIAGKRNLEKLIRSESFKQNTLLLGDMNEWRFMPGSFKSKVKDVMHVKTGSLLNPTWRYDARRFTLLRLNLDYIYWSKRSDFYLKDFEILSSDVSDHRPLLATFALSGHQDKS